MEYRDGPTKPMRKKLYPSQQKIEMFITDRVASIWKCNITAEEHNVARKRPGGRDESWPEEEFMHKFQQAIQFPTQNECLIFLFKGYEGEDEDSLTLNVKERCGKVVINYNNPAVLEKCCGEAAESALRDALAEENNLFRTHCIGGRLELVKVFVRNGVSVNGAYPECWSPLQLALKYGHEELCRWLVQQGCDLLRVSPDGKCALHMAVEAGQLEMVKLLVQRGVPLEEETYENMEKGVETPLMLATLHQHTHIVQWMCGPQGYRAVREAKKFGPRNTSKGTGMFETVEGHYPQVWGVTAGVDDGVREGMFA